ncbi:hypothetical protein GGR54DRAFT_607749 [Hypoxylon sp. NC1633]|nr:hypothetical protein GGR54DRAFT_607749 [Hypoxylon sp. NC1633]
MTKSVGTMDGDDMNAEPWRRIRLGDEPIYCAAPPPTDLDDIVCVGSDEELDEDAKVAKRLRYEAQGLRYLQGKPLRLLSASLRGPFDRASGWQNPWLPKQPAVMKPVVEPPRLPTKKQRRKNLQHQFRHDDITTTQDTDNSIPCHLPSPDSTRELQLFNSPLGRDQHIRIQTWAKEVSSSASTLGRDPFWAPGQEHDEESDEPGKKRAAGKEWLKKIPFKRKRLDGSQKTAAASTPTPMLPAHIPRGSRSVPRNTGQAKVSFHAGAKASQSFELTTPSSTANLSCLEVPYKEQPGSSTKHRRMPSRNEITHTPRPAPASNDTIMRSTNMAIDAIYHEPSPAINPEHCQVSNPEPGRISSQTPENTVHQDPQRGEGAEEDIGLESYMDQSFHYRARPPKQETLDLISPDEPTPVTCPEATQTIPLEPRSPSQDNTAATAVMRVERQSPDHQQVASLEQQSYVESVAIAQASQRYLDWMCERDNDKQHSEVLLAPEEEVPEDDQQGDQGGNQVSKHNNAIIEPGPSEDQHLPAENTELIRIASAAASAMAELTTALPVQHDLIGNENPITAKNDSYTSDSLLVAETLGSTPLPEESTKFEIRSHGREPVLDEGSTLVDDSMNVDQSISLEVGDLPTICHAPNSSDIKSISASEPHSSTKRVEDDGEQKHESDDESNLVVIPLSQFEWGVADVVDNSPTKPRASPEDNTKASIVQDGEVSTEDGPVQATLPDSPTMVRRQSPWAVNLPPMALLTAENIKPEQINDRPSPCLPRSSPVSRDSKHRISLINPSQQSPWSKQPLEPAKILERADLPTTIFTGVKSENVAPATVISEQGQSPWTKMESGVIFQPNLTYDSPTPAFQDEKSPLSRPRQPTPVNESDQRLSGYFDRGPSTPPPFPVPSSRTPDRGTTIKPFSRLFTPSPKRRSRQSSMRYSSIGPKPAILSSATLSSIRGSRRSSRRVSFALLPNEGDDSGTLAASDAPRAASPPPQVAVDAEDEDVSNLFRNHFDAMKQRAIYGDSVHLRIQPQLPLLPSSSQRVAVSPPVNAMAEAFREADALMAYKREYPVEDLPVDDDQEMGDSEQSPWRKESQVVDDVAVVMENLGDFLDTWDVDAEIRKSRSESVPGAQGWGASD